jgi:NitT/TauT family transport system ATP-binding protein
MILRCSNLDVVFGSDNGDISALRNVSLEIAEREFVSIVGPSGCGKTTLLRVLAKLIDPTAGAVEYVTDATGIVGPVLLVFQEDNLFPWMNVLQNAAFGLMMQGVEREVREQQTGELLRAFGLQGREQAYPKELSVGMKQRVAITRAFVSQPAVLLMDEPFAAVDYQTRLRLQQELLALWEKHRSTVIFVTHDVDEAILLSDRILVLSQQPGTVIAETRVPFERPRTHELALQKGFLELKRDIARQLGLSGLGKESEE